MEVTEDTTMGVQIEEEMSAIRVIQIVTKLWVSVWTVVERNKSHQFKS
jgi:hypothetical protein